MKRENMCELLGQLRSAGILNDQTSDLSDLSEKVLPFVKRTRMMNPIEYGRCEHAEQSALFDAARRGASVKDTVLYTTTFPCHECARHIVTAGVKRVVYIEPYPKSLASRFHSDAIEFDPATPSADKVTFEAFVGVSPRQYARLFNAPVRKLRNGAIVDWKPAEANPRIRNSDMSYLELEDLALKKLRGQISQVDLEL